MGGRNKEMNPCILCGWEGELLKEREFFAVRCRNPSCGRNVPILFDEEDWARDFWNAKNPKGKRSEEGTDEL